ncbi:MAG: fumarylacetoacetate hydrolase family protein [Myxococcota bacterium]|nr:fumarylacetoacetate hydrolase family protein [Myxococcota bacterium]MDW8361597.1 fumarylacetoacetate hydrolase family protein [Myxococcales bacterium]
MRLATVRDGSRDGRLVVVSSDGRRMASAAAIASTLQSALDDWERTAPRLAALAADLDAGRIAGAEPLDESTPLGPPLPRAYEWIDGSAYLSHVVLVRRARGAEPPPTLRTDPLVYQGGSGVLLGPRDDIELPDVAWGCDFEAEVAVILGDVPRGTSAAAAERYIRLVMLVNDVTLRNLVPDELAKGFGFFQSKPASAFSPFAVTPDELGPAWRAGRLHLPLRTYLDDRLVGDIDAGAEMHFSFCDLIAHIARTRSFTAGTILGGGTVSTEDPARGVSCLAERRMREQLRDGRPTTPFLQPGNRVRIEMFDDAGRNVFGSIDQKVVAA